MIYRIATIILVARAALFVGSGFAAERNVAPFDGPVSTVMEIRTLAEQGNINAQATLGQMYYKGDGVPRDFSSALDWLQRAAARQHAGATMTLALMYAQGQAVKKDLAKAFALAQTAADKGNAIAQRVVGNMYDSGKGIARDLKKAFEWYQKAAIQGDIDAQYNLGTMYYSGEGGTFDKVLAYAWFCLATDPGLNPTKVAIRLRNKIRMSLSKIELAEVHQLLAGWKPGQTLERIAAKSTSFTTDPITPKLTLDYEIHER